MILAPPLLAGGLKLTVICAFPGTPTTLVGALGTVAGAVGVTVAEAADAGPLPTEFVAYAVQVYGSPFVSPITTIGLPVPLTVPEVEPLEELEQVAV